jgi:transposase
MTIIPDLSDLVIEQVRMTNEVTITVRAASPTAPCPCCGIISKRIQSRYRRTLRDLPASGRPVHLVLHVRRFFCQESTCVRKIFAERFPALTLPRVKFTLRLQEALGEMGFELGGEAGARLGKKLSYPGSPDTILRLVKRAELPAASSPHVVGLDDWSWKRRQRYGTLICDLESHKPIDVLPDRSVETVSAWFVAHPSVEIVSRDRSSEYAAAIKKGAPQATEVADRWHLGKNLAESLQTLLARCRAEIRRGLHVQVIAEQEQAETQPVLEEEKHLARSPREEQARLARRAQKQDRYEQVLELRDQGLSAADIGSRIGMSGRTVQRWLAHGSFPEARQRRRRPSLIDPYERYVLQWWQEGNRNGLLMRDNFVPVNPITSDERRCCLPCGSAKSTTGVKAKTSAPPYSAPHLRGLDIPWCVTSNPPGGDAERAAADGRHTTAGLAHGRQDGGTKGPFGDSSSKAPCPPTWWCYGLSFGASRRACSSARSRTSACNEALR